MGADPLDKQMHPCFSKMVATDHPVVISANVEYNPVGTIPKDIGTPANFYRISIYTGI
jgi:hypothetical protein